jgi:hypothetical protein
LVFIIETSRAFLRSMGLPERVTLHARQAFHALHDQGLASAPLWDSETASVPGMISASDFIQARCSLGSALRRSRSLPLLKTVGEALMGCTHSRWR